MLADACGADSGYAMSEDGRPFDEPASPSRRALLARGAALAAGAAAAWTTPGAVRGLSAALPEASPTEVRVVRELAEVGRAGTRAIVEPAHDPVVAHAAVGIRAPRRATVHVRSQRADGAWSSWRLVPVTADEGPDRHSEEGRRSVAAPRAPVWTGPVGRTQLAVDGVDPGDVELALIDPLGLGDGLADRLRSLIGSSGDRRAAHADNRPAIRGRAEWGARPPRRHPSYASGVDLAIVHHTVTGNGYSREQTWGLARAVQYHHQQVNGWDDIGYNFLIDRFGRIIQARHGGVGQPVIGAHAGGFNAGSVGIGVLGDHRHRPLGTQTYEALVTLLTWLCERHDIDPRGHTSQVSGGSTRYPHGHRVTLPTICGHRDVSQTTCPGEPPYHSLEAVREDVARRMPRDDSGWLPLPGLLGG